MLLDNKIILNICNISIKAGSIINKYYRSKINISLKKDKSPLTEADIASNKFIVDSLFKLDSDIPVLSEEYFVNWKIRKNWNKYWLVDPLDGTKEFINRNNEFTVNIALIENNIPKIGVIYAPVTGNIFFASENQGAYKLKSIKEINSLNESKKLQLMKKNMNETINVIVSRSHKNLSLENWLKKTIKNYNIIFKGSSLKFCELAEGNADIYPRFGPTSEWDIAAGHIILNEAGGNLKTLDDKKILYNTKADVINPNFIASCKFI